MKKLHVSELSDAEISAVFSTAVEEAVARAKAAGYGVPTITTPATASLQRTEAAIAEVAELLKQEARDRLGRSRLREGQPRNQKSA